MGLIRRHPVLPPAAGSADSDVLALTRWTAVVIVAFLVPAVLMLYLLPGRTDELWAWTIKPDLSAMTLATAYVAGTYFFARATVASSWSRIAAGLPAVTVFVWAMAGATLLHDDRFHDGHVSFVAWAALYAVSPVGVPAVWWWNSRRARPPRPPDMPGGMRAALAAGGVAVLAGAVALFADPAWAAAEWPWDITPLTGRVTAGVIALYGAVWVSVAAYGRWRTARLPLQALVLGLGAWLVAIGLRADDLGDGRALAVPVVGGAAVVLVTTVAVLASRRRVR